MAGCGGKSAEEIASALRTEITSVKPEQQYEALTGKAREAAKEATCNALEAYSSHPAEAVTDELKREAKLQQVSQSLELPQVAPTLPQSLIDAADGIDSTQKASDVLAKLSC